jgi:hypothetical protein
MGVVLKVFTIKCMTTDVADFVHLTRKFIWTKTIKMNKGSVGK